jgi:prohibitin 2
MDNPFRRSGKDDPFKRITPEGETIESTGRPKSVLRIVAPILIGIIIISVIAISSVRTVDAVTEEFWFNLEMWLLVIR